jgi:hypothetical protein
MKFCARKSACPNQSFEIDKTIRSTPHEVESNPETKINWATAGDGAQSGRPSVVLTVASSCDQGRKVEFW